MKDQPKTYKIIGSGLPSYTESEWIKLAKDLYVHYVINGKTDKFSTKLYREILKKFNYKEL